MSLVNLFGAIALDASVQTLISEVRGLVKETRDASISRALGVLSDVRVTFTGAQPVTISSGTVTTTTTVGTVNSVTNQAQLGGFGANALVQNWNNTNAILGNTANITITP